jgi:hypothetical protein
MQSLASIMCPVDLANSSHAVGHHDLSSRRLGSLVHTLDVSTALPNILSCHDLQCLLLSVTHVSNLSPALPSFNYRAHASYVRGAWSDVSKSHYRVGRASPPSVVVGNSP